MLDGGLSPNVKDKVFHEPIIFQSLKAKNTETLEAMLDSGADVNATNSLGKTLVFDALDNQAYDHVLLLLDRGADPSVKAKNGWSMSNALADALSGLDRGSEQYEKLNEIKRNLFRKGACGHLRRLSDCTTVIKARDKVFSGVSISLHSLDL